MTTATTDGSSDTCVVVAGAGLVTWKVVMDRDCLFVAYFASAELGCHRVSGWPDPINICDLFVEYSNLRNGVVGARSLLDAALAFQLSDAISAEEKDRNRQLVPRGGPWSSNERATILEYCDADVRLTGELFRAMALQIAVDHACLAWAIHGGRRDDRVLRYSHRSADA